MKIELHAHTSETSGCGKMPAEELIGRFKGAGYDALVVTDHLVGEKNAATAAEERIERWIRGYRAAKKAGDRVGLTVLMGVEVRFASRPEDILVYGVKEEDIRWILPMLDADAALSEFYARAQECGLLVVQAHPFRKGLTRLDQRYLDGSEVYNGNARHNNHHDLAHEFGEQGGADFIKTSGSDAHQTMDVARGGLMAPDGIHTNEELTAFLRSAPNAERIETM